MERGFCVSMSDVLKRPCLNKRNVQQACVWERDRERKEWVERERD